MQRVRYLAAFKFNAIKRGYNLLIQTLLLTSKYTFINVLDLAEGYQSRKAFKRIHRKILYIYSKC